MNQGRELGVFAQRSQLRERLQGDGTHLIERGTQLSAVQDVEGSGHGRQIACGAVSDLV